MRMKNTDKTLIIIKKIINNKMNDCLSTFNKKNNLLKKWEYDIRKMGYIKIYNDLLFCLFS